MALAPSTPRKMTADEFFALPEELPHPQLIDGELVLNRPAYAHQRIVVELIGLFRLYAEAHPGVGELGIEISTLIDEHNVYVPDLWWVPAGHDDVHHHGPFEGPPPLVVEVRSPSTWRHDLGTKLRRYEAHGAAEVWLVDTEGRQVLVRRRSSPASASFDVAFEVGLGELLATPMIPGWAIDLTALFDPSSR